MAVKITPTSPPTESASPSAGAKRMSGEALFALGDIGRTELVRGELVKMSPTGHPPAFVEFNIGRILGNFVYDHKLGRVLGGEVGIYTGRNPDTVRGADVAFISNERLTKTQAAGYLDVAPELVVEVLSPDDSWSKVNEKLEEYFAAGVQLVWIADPRREQLYAYRSLTEIERFTADDTLTGGDVLPGFQIEVKKLFN